MQFITMEDYNAYDGEPILAEDFSRCAARACEAVDAACGWRLSGGIDRFPEWAQHKLRLAACVQAEYLMLNGIETATDGFSAMDGYHIGKTSVTLHVGSYNGRNSHLSGGLCEKAYALVAATGLMNRSAAVEGA